MKDTGTRLFNLCATLIVAAGLMGLTGCNSDDVTNNPTGGGGAADIDVTTSTPASGDTNISGAGVTVVTTLDAGSTRVQVDATTDGNLRRIFVYFTTATGAVEAVSYSWGVANLNDNIVYCPTAGCTNVTVNTTTQEISFAGTVLDNHGAVNPGDPATKFATLGAAVPASLVQYPNP